MVETDVGQLEAAGPRLQQYVSQVRAQLGPNHPKLGSALLSLSEIMAQESNGPLAVDYAKEALSNRESFLAEPHENLAAVWRTLGRGHVTAGEYEEAIHAFERSLAMTRELYPAGHYQTCDALCDSAMVYVLMLDQPEKARPLLEESLEMSRRVRGERTLTYQLSLTAMGVLLDAEGDLNGAAETFEQVMAHMELWAGWPWEVDPRLYYASTLLALGRFERAEELAREAQKLTLGIAVSEHNNRRPWARVVLGAVLVADGRPDEGQPLVDEGLKELERFGVNDHRYRMPLRAVERARAPDGIRSKANE